jgi:HSP20 family protein
MESDPSKGGTMASESTSGQTGEQRTTSSTGQRAEEGTSQQSSLQRGEAYTGASGWPTPFALMRRLFDDMERMVDEYIPGRFGPEGSGRDLQRFAREGFWIPQIDVFEREGKLVVRADLPGLTKEDVRAEIEGGQLVLQGERRRERAEERGGRYRAERSYGSFRRVVPLPEGADTEHAEARFDNGVLEVTVPLPEERTRSRRIDIQEGKQSPSVH